jgi:hypothetical protein
MISNSKAEQKTQNNQSGSQYGPATSGIIGKGGSQASSGGISFVLNSTDKSKTAAEKRAAKKAKQGGGGDTSTAAGGGGGNASVSITQESPEAIELANNSLTVLQAAFEKQAEVSARALQTSADFAALSFPTQIALGVVNRPVDEAYYASGAAAAGADQPGAAAGNHKALVAGLLVVGATLAVIAIASN